jgi:hypothetical protein
MTTWGAVTVERHRTLERQGIRLRVWRFNQDVTNDCVFFDDTPGFERAVLLQRDAAGRHFIDPATGVIAREVVHSFEVREGR